MPDAPLPREPEAEVPSSAESLGVEAARQLATTTKTVPQMLGITPRWLLTFLPWVQVASGTYRVNRVRARQVRVPGQAGSVTQPPEVFDRSDPSFLSGHRGEPVLPQMYFDYEEQPREYPLSAVQTVVRVHTRVSDLYNDPHDQLREQLRLAIEGIKERQEWELVNNPEFGLLVNAAPSMRISSRTGRPTPDDMDELLSRVWKKPAFFLAHPQALAAFCRECTRRGVPPPTVTLYGCPFVTWRGVPLVPCDKLPIEEGGEGPGSRRSSILLLRVGEEEQGVVGLHHAGLPGEQGPSLSVRLMGIDEKAIASYLITLYFSVAVLTDDALGVLENVELGHYHHYA